MKFTSFCIGLFSVFFSLDISTASAQTCPAGTKLSAYKVDIACRISITPPGSIFGTDPVVVGAPKRRFVLCESSLPDNRVAINMRLADSTQRRLTGLTDTFQYSGAVSIALTRLGNTVRLGGINIGAREIEPFVVPDNGLSLQYYGDTTSSYVANEFNTDEMAVNVGDTITLDSSRNRWGVGIDEGISCSFTLNGPVTATTSSPSPGPALPVTQ